MNPHPLVAEAKRLLDQEHLDPDELNELSQQVRTKPPTEPDTARALLALIETLSQRVSTELDVLGHALKEAAASKKALAGYGFVKPTVKNQHANKVV
ncbi:MAG: hypothetical protein AAGA48_24025 [Myxococcota bacterium]